MTGIQIFKRSIERVVQNLPEALAVSGVIWIAVLILDIALLDRQAMGDMLSESMTISTDQGSGSTGQIAQTAQRDENGNIVYEDAPPVGLAMRFLLVNLIAAVGSCWIAVAWHRFTILGERPVSAIPPLRVGGIMRYLGWSILIGLILMVMGTMALSIVSGIVGPSFATPLLVFVGFAMFYGFLRLSPVLPASALDRRLKLGAAWGATAPIASAIVQLAIFNILAMVLLTLLSAIAPGGIFFTLYWLCAGWAVLIVSVSQLSIIYDECVDGAST